MTDQKGKLVLYSGSSGVGKGTILKKLMELDENVCLSVSDTTREPREGEIDGVHYNFVTRDNFKEKIASGGYLEYAEYCHNFYGTPIQQLRDLLGEGKTVFLEIEVEGAMNIKRQYPEAVLIMLLPPFSLMIFSFILSSENRLSRYIVNSSFEPCAPGA